MSDYVLSSTAEAERLRVQARAWEPDANALLDVIQIQPGWRCLDVGCGAMGILGPLSRRVGPSGRVIGIDRDPPLLAAARSYVKEEGLTNVEILERDAWKTELPRSSFDLVHARFVFPYGRSEDLLQEMMSLAVPGGIVVAQEPDQSSWNFFPPRPAWERLRQTFEDAFRHLGGDINIGRRTYGLFRRAGLQNVQVRAAVLALQPSHPYSQMPIISATGLRKVIVGANLMTTSELDETLAEMEQILRDPETFSISFTVTQVWGKKPTQ